MEHNTYKLPRLEVVDALRGFALFAILLVHNVEHYIFFRSIPLRRPSGL